MKQALRGGFAALLLLLLLCGCTASGEQLTPDDSADILGSAAEDPAAQEELPTLTTFTLPCLQGQTLDPITCPDGAQQNIAALLYEGLFSLDETFTPQNRLCSAYTYDAPQLTYRFTLRADVRFSDGSALTAEDAAATLQRAAASVRYGGRFKSVASIRADGAQTLVVTLTRNNAAFPALLDIPVVKRGTETNLVPTGTGAYTYVTGDGAPYLAPNTNWWQGAKQPTDRIDLISAKDADTLVYLFSAHEVQLLTSDLTGSAPISATGSIDFSDVPTTSLQYLVCNTTRGFLADAQARSAVSRAIDRATLVGAHLSGHAVPAQFPLSPATVLYPEALLQDTSREPLSSLLKERRDAGQPVDSLTLLVNSENRFKVSAATYISQQLTAQGLTTQLRVLDWDAYTQALAAGEFDLCYAEVRLSADWDVAPLVASGGALNYSRYANIAVDNLIASFLAHPDDGSAAALCALLQREAPIIPLCFKETSVLLQPHVVDTITPTAADPFYRFEDWTFHLAGK